LSPRDETCACTAADSSNNKIGVKILMVNVKPRGDRIKDGKEEK
jgi:hypothetical protein